MLQANGGACYNGRMKRILLLINPYHYGSSALYQPLRMQQALGDLGVAVDVVSNEGALVWLQQGQVCLGEVRHAWRLWQQDGRVLGERAEVEPRKVADYAACIYWDKDKYTSHLLERAGVRLFNPAKAIEDCDDKLQTFVRLAEAGIPLPNTVGGSLCYTPDAKVSEAQLSAVERTLGYPMVVKTCYGSFGEGVRLVRNREELHEVAEELLHVPHLFQQYVAESFGRDLRVIVVGGKVLSAMERRSAVDFRSNVELGGVASAVREIPPEAIAICEKAAAVLGLDYCGCDLLWGKDGKMYLCEVNSNAYFGGMEKTGVNVAAAYARHILDQLSK